MIRGVLAALLIGAATLAVAETAGPDIRRVVDVASDDVLNIRAEPSASSEIIGTYPHDASRIEVIGMDPSGRWAEVGIGELNGWASARYLQSVPISAEGIPRPLHCFGAEPFWSVRLPENHDDAYWDSEVGDQYMGDMVIDEATSFGYVGQFVTGSSHDVRVMVITRQICSDGMADRLLSWDVILTTRETGRTFAVSGCCTFDGAEASWR